MTRTPARVTQADVALMGEHFQPKPVNRLEAAINKLLADGKRVERATDIPGLYYIDNGPELTEMQVIHLAESPP